MHFHADHSLFFETKRPLRDSVRSVVLVVVVLIANVGLNDARASLIGVVLGGLLLTRALRQGDGRVEPLVAWTFALIGMGLIGSAAFQLDLGRFIDTACRILCGMVWVLWLGTQIDWASIRQMLIWARTPLSVVSSLDHAVMHGTLTRSEWVRRRDAARLRQGKPLLPLWAWGRLLGEGALHSFSRIESVEEQAFLRGSSGPTPAGGGDDVSLVEVSIERGDQTVLRDLNLHLPPKSSVILCGASGAGKSSLLRLLAGFEAPAEGVLSRFDVEIGPKATLKRRLDGRVGFLSQNPEHHFIASTVEEDIMWGMLRRGIGPEEASRRTLEFAQALRVEHLMARACHTLSFGEQRRVALAGLLVTRPRLLLLDEPTAGLDPLASAEIRELVERSFIDTCATCIWATHELHALPPMADRILLLANQGIIYDGPVDLGLSHDSLVSAGLAVSKGEQT